MIRDILCLAAIPVAILALNACPPITPPATPPDAQFDADIPTNPIDSSIEDCTAACAGMVNAGCQVLATCPNVMCRANADPRFRHYDTTCLSHALVPADVRACGTDCTPRDQ